MLAADILARCITRSSSDMILTIYKSSSIIREGGLQSPVWLLRHRMKIIHWLLGRFEWKFTNKYRQVSNIKRTLVGNKIDDHSDVVGASPVGAAPTTSSFST